MHIDRWTRRIDRRTVLKSGAMVAGAVPFRRTWMTSRHPDSQTRHDGESLAVGAGEVTTYATTNPSGRLSSLGVHVDGEAMAAFGDEEVRGHLHFPTETTEDSEIDLHQFTFMGFHYNPAGHPPPGIYTVPHFDFHFYMLPDEEVERISGGPLGDAPLPFLGLADYEVPDEQFPPGYVHEQHRFIVEEMGEHLLDGTAPEFQGEPFTHTYVYGAHDPAICLGRPDRFETVELQGEEVDLPVYVGDGEGQVHFVEPMITTDFVRDELTEEVTVEVATPDVFAVADDYPTEYVMRPDGDGGVFVSVDGFEAFPGPSE